MPRKFFSVSQIAREHNFAPRALSDLFYSRKLSDENCPIIGRTRMIPADYLPTVLRALREAGVIAKVSA